MKIELKTFITNPGKQPVEYSQLLIGALNQPPQGGFTPSVMKERIELIDRLEDAKDTLEVSSEELAIIKKLVANQSFGIIDKGLIEYTDYIAGL